MSRRTNHPARAHRVEILEPRTLLAFGLTTTSSTYTVDTGASLVFSQSPKW